MTDTWERIGLGGATLQLVYQTPEAATAAVVLLMNHGHGHHFAVVGEGQTLVVSELAAECLAARYRAESPLDVGGSPMTGAEAEAGGVGGKSAEEEAADVLEAHQVKTGIRDMNLHCMCGWTTSLRDRGSGKKHREHVVWQLSQAGLLAGTETVDDAEALPAGVRARLVKRFYSSEIGGQGFYGREESEQIVDAILPVVGAVVVEQRKVAARVERARIEKAWTDVTGVESE